MSAPAEIEAKPFAPVARAVKGSSVIPAETEEHKKMEEKMEEKKGVKKGDIKPVYPVPAVEEGRMESKTDPPAKEKEAERSARGAKTTRRISTRVIGFFKTAKVNDDIPVVAEEAPKLAEVATASAPLYEPTYPIPAVEEGRMETETATPEKPIKATEKPEGKRARNTKVTRRLSTRIAALFKGGKVQG